MNSRLPFHNPTKFLTRKISSLIILRIFKIPHRQPLPDKNRHPPIPPAIKFKVSIQLILNNALLRGVKLRFRNQHIRARPRAGLPLLGTSTLRLQFQHCFAPLDVLGCGVVAGKESLEGLWCYACRVEVGFGVEGFVAFAFAGAGVLLQGGHVDCHGREWLIRTDSCE